MNQGNQMSHASLEKMTGPNSLLGTDADGNDHHTAPAGDGGYLAWIVADGAVVYDQTVDSLGAYVDHVADVTGWGEVNYSERGLGEALCDVVETESDSNAGKELVTDGGVDHDDEFDGGASIIEVDGYESYVDPEHLDSCERAGAEVREE